MSTEGELRPDIERAVAAMAAKTGSKRAIETLHERLDEGETVTALTVAGKHPEGGLGLLVLTGRRLFYYRRGRTGSDYFEIPWQSGNAVSLATGLLTSKITVSTPAGPWEFVGLSRKDGERFVDALRAHTYSQPNANPPQWYAASPPPAPSPEPSAQVSDSGGPSAEEEIISHLERLGALYERGILDEEEFASAKRDLLARLRTD